MTNATFVMQLNIWIIVSILGFELTSNIFYAIMASLGVLGNIFIFAIYISQKKRTNKIEYHRKE